MRTTFPDTDSRIVTTGELINIYYILLDTYGHQHWWPSEGWFETIIGAILAQNVSWEGAAKAVQALKNAGLLSPDILARSDQEDIAPLIRSSRYYNQKAGRILGFSRWFMIHYQGNINRMNREETISLRNMLLNLSGFGPETVDSILLYACNKPVFVVDAYTRRIGSRIGWFPEDASYQRMQDFFMSLIKPDLDLYNDFHAQIVHLGNRICRKKPDCVHCPLTEGTGTAFCRYQQVNQNNAISITGASE